MADDKMQHALDMFENFSLDEQITIIEENIKLRGGSFPMAEALLKQLKSQKEKQQD